MRIRRAVVGLTATGLALAGGIASALGAWAASDGSAGRSAASTSAYVYTTCGWQQDSAQAIHGACSPGDPVTYRLSAACRATGVTPLPISYRLIGQWKENGNASTVTCKNGYELV